MSAERLVYINGELVPEGTAAISIFDIGFMYGVTLYESLRTFKQQWFALADHWQRLRRSLGYAGLQGLVSEADFRAILDATLAANIHLTCAGDDVWGNFQVTPGRAFPMPLLEAAAHEPTVLCYTAALPHAEYARSYVEGRHAVTSLFRSPSPQSYEQRVKNRSRFPHFMAKREAARIDPGAFGLLLDSDGFVAEGTGANIFFVLDGVLHTPTPRNILVGVSRQNTIRLARDLGIEVAERDLTLYDAYNADEAFWTTSSYCILPISMIDGRRIGEHYPGPVAQRLLDAWSAEVGVDIIGQAQKMAGDR